MKTPVAATVMSSIPFLDLGAQYRAIKSEIAAAIQRVLDTTQFVLGEEVAAFEHDFARYCATRHAVAVNSGTSALHLALLAEGIGPGDEVITIPFTFIATAAAISYTGATPVLVDVEPEYFTMDPSRLEAAITPRTRAIMPVHLYGQCADMAAIVEIADRHGIPVIEDAAQAHGADFNGRRAGSMGHSACFSFYPGKNLGAYGEGGAVVTNDDAVADKIRILRDWGARKKYDHAILGYNYRMEGLQGAILRVKLAHLEDWTERRRSRAALYDQGLAGAGVHTPRARPGSRHVYHVYAVRSDKREALREHLSGRGIGVGIHYPIPVHLQGAFSGLGHHAGDFPESERAGHEVLSLPMYPELSDAAVAEVAEAVCGFDQ